MKGGTKDTCEGQLDRQAGSKQSSFRTLSLTSRESYSLPLLPHRPTVLQQLNTQQPNGFPFHLVKGFLPKKKSQILALSTVLHPAGLVKQECVFESELCSFTVQLHFYMRRIRTVQSLWTVNCKRFDRKRYGPRWEKKNCWISTPSTLILSFKLLRIWILLQIQTSLNMTTRTLVYCPCTLWTVQTRNNAEQATLKCRYLYSNLHGAVPHKNLNIHQLRYETLGTCVYSSLRPFWLGFLTNSLLIYRKLLKFEDVTLNTLRCQKVFFEPVNFSRQYANY